ncbi:MAG TPA: glutaredoxin family protein [Planctomycetaceae bacterium]|jgi:glutaredoxin|nr:glutaredoxin family protein [Planctomycetaceae bacterium]
MSSPIGPRESETADDDHRREEFSQDRFRPALGSLLLFLGIGVLGLLAADRSGGLPIHMPRSWYIDRGLWVAIGLLAFGAGWYLLGDRKPSDEESRSKESGGRDSHSPPSGLRFERVVLYTRPGCHLCDLARETLEKHRESLPSPIEIDIDTDPALRARFSTCVPVVEIDGKIRFRGGVNEVLLRRLIDATPPRIGG